MKTKKLPLLLAIAAFGLTSCFDIIGQTDSAQSTGNTDSSDIVDSVISSDSETEDSSSSEGPSATSSEGPASSSSEGPSSSSSEEPTASTSDEPGPSSSEEPASSTSEEPATSTSEEPADTGTSEEPADTDTSEEPEPEPEPEPAELNWPAYELLTYVRGLLSYRGDIAIPTPSQELDAGRTYSISLDYMWSSTRSRIIAVTATGDFTSYADEAVATGDWLEPNYEFASYRFLHSVDEALQILVYNYDEDTDTTDVLISNNSFGYFAMWPEATVGAWIESVTRRDDYTPLPGIDDGLIDILVFEDYGDYSEIAVFCSDNALAADYERALIEAGFKEVSTPAATFFLDPDLDYFVRVYDYLDDYGYIALGVYSISWWGSGEMVRDASGTWLDWLIEYFEIDPEEIMFEAFPDFDLVESDFCTGVYGFDNDDIPYFEVYYWKWDDNGDLVDLTEDYIELMDEMVDGGEWYYSEEYGGYIGALSGVLSLRTYGPDEVDASCLVRIEYGDFSQYLPAEAEE